MINQINPTEIAQLLVDNMDKWGDDNYRIWVDTDDSALRVAHVAYKPANSTTLYNFGSLERDWAQEEWDVNLVESAGILDGLEDRISDINKDIETWENNR